ncbi:Uncharacterized protein OS=Crocosphaera watsonii WH 8501 GN=CwatDRAFT_1334 PE=4 SV=1 [Gemmataceae bacterium]|jgi:hypothetical protein|nr:Uncharacterized protein OS=Crocosphaera watsonii WH 8501 GN=CwatDRAFT_1334 PE=4 SV=1 [Gemmataceae bacterium]VTT97522.1 Uncharacterized protein OS=Crocosphaera watsonii WH 8501 GN=CwatDRAFT_1334 PE=4 SV=1 [Gemmataceae bacterium]
MNALLVGLCCFAAHVAVTLVWLRVKRGPSPVARHAASALGTHAAGVLAGAWVAGPLAYWPAAAVSGFGAVCWLFAFSAVYKSVSLRILSQLSRTPGNALPFVAIAEAYVRPEFEARVAVLVKMGCAEEDAGGYAATAAGNATARRIAGIQRACGIEASGLYGGAIATQSSP